MSRAKKSVYNILGVFFTILAVIGYILPLIPTVPFLLVALWSFSKSSPRMERWLLNNKYFGRYLKDYKEQRGIPVIAKIFTIAILWGSITITALFLTDLLWLRILLLITAVAITIHVMRIKTKEKITIALLIPTELEAKGMVGRLPSGVDLYTSGVGMAETAACLARVVTKRTKTVILAGIAGAYQGSGVKIGDVVVVESEIVADLGAMRDGEFSPLFQKEYRSPLAEKITSLPKVRSNSVSTGGGANISKSEAQIENMEGSSFFSVCEALGVDYVEIRAISNFTDAPRSDWKIEEAVTALHDAILTTIEEIKNLKK